jgi:conjugal transfer pilus assembly protein TraV
MKLRAQYSRMNKTAPLLALITLSLLGGCATLLGGNVKGSFACSAPGGTCAPTQVIDDGALGSTASDPATPVSSGDPALGGSFQRTALGAQAPLRTGERVLRIVFPPRVDRAGRYREAYAVHAVVNRSAWADARDPASQGASLVPSVDAGLAALASSAPALGFASDIFGTEAAELEPPSSSGQALGAAANKPAKSATLGASGAVPPAALLDDAKRSVDRVFAGQARAVRAPATTLVPIKPVALPVSLVATPSAAQSASQPATPPKSHSASASSGTGNTSKAVSAHSGEASNPAATVKTIKATGFSGTVDTGGDK